MPRNAHPSTRPGNPPPTFVFPDSDNESDHLLDLDPPEPSKLFASSPPLSGGFLVPGSMADDSPSDVGGSTASPFNFQTQVISTAPVKSVRSVYLASYQLHELTVYRILVSVEDTDTSIVVSQHSTRSSKSRLRDHPPFSQPPSRYRR